MRTLLTESSITLSLKEAIEWYKRGGEAREKALYFFPEMYLKTWENNTVKAAETLKESMPSISKKLKAYEVLTFMAAEAWEEEYKKEEISKAQYILTWLDDGKLAIYNTKNPTQFGTVVFPSLSSAQLAYNTLAEMDLI